MHRSKQSYQYLYLPEMDQVVPDGEKLKHSYNTSMIPRMKCFFCIVFVSISFFSQAQDWPNLKKFQADNEKLMTETAPKDRVVFMGNSITIGWIQDAPEFFEANHFVNRGISGQTSPQMLLRFRADVIALHPKAVVIECGTNDIAGNTGHSTVAMVEDNIMSMAELARANKIKVIIGSVLPANKFGWKPVLQPADSIIALNQWLKAYADRNHFAYIDYYSSLVDDQKGMKAVYSTDGVHPNKEGYTVMEGLALPVIKKVL
ncbi:MAG: SGNH/GDSL hydrolase family protein [Bacteroidota bacterium]